MKTIPFICVNYKSEQETLVYIENVISLEDSSEATIVVVDNSPDDASFLILQKFIKNLDQDIQQRIFLLRVENRGYFHGLNEGILHLHRLGIQDTYFVVGNNDIIFKHDFIVKLKNLVLDDDILVLAPDVITTTQSHENPHVIEPMGRLRKLKYDLFFSHYLVAKMILKVKSIDRPFKPYDAERKIIHMGIGALYVLTPKFFKHFTTLAEEVFLYGEEAILAGQMQSVKGKILYEPDLVCWHNESATTSRLGLKTVYYNARKSYKVYRKYL